MRLVGLERERAKEDLLELLALRPRTTGELQGTRRFHGMRTLSLWQIRALLRETGCVHERVVGAGMRTTTLWTWVERPSVVDAGVGAAAG